MRRALALLTALLLAAQPAAAAAPRVTVGAGRVLAAGSAAPLPALGAVAAPLSATLTRASLPLAPSSLLPAPAAQPALRPLAAAPAAPAKAVASVLTVVAPRRAANDDDAGALAALRQGAALAAASADDVGRLYDAPPAAPDLASLATVKETVAPRDWAPSTSLLKPAASLVNAFRRAAHDRRRSRLEAHERVTTEEQGMRQSLMDSYAQLAEGRLQQALSTLSDAFTGETAEKWYRANERYLPYQLAGRAYIGFIHGAIGLAARRARGRSGDATLVAEAQDAALAGTLVGRPYRATSAQERGSGHCAHHALYNAISASFGFAHPVSVERFIGAARETLNVSGEKATGLSGAELARLERRVGLSFGRDVGRGMAVDTVQEWGRLLGLEVEARGPPQGDAAWTELLRSGKETLVGLRRPPHVNHMVYLLGAFDSPSRGARVYMVQDSAGEGRTEFYTAEELSAVAHELALVRVSGPVALPGPAAK